MAIETAQNPLTELHNTYGSTKLFYCLIIKRRRYMAEYRYSRVEIGIEELGINEMLQK